MPRPRPVFSRSAFNRILALPKRTRRVALNLSDELARDPAFEPDFSVKVENRWWVAFLWADGLRLAYAIDDISGRVMVLEVIKAA
jgi:mRNA-degrading endonuclease RelE of RelBE toxin-antitoxin system